MDARDPSERKDAEFLKICIYLFLSADTIGPRSSIYFL